MEQPNDIRQIRQITLTGLLLNFGLASIKMIVGWIGSSQAVIADGVHSLSDMATDFAVIFGVKIWSAPPDASHPYGHRRVEALITTIIGLSLLGVAIGLGYHSLLTIREPDIQQTGWVALLGPVLSILFKEILFRWTMKVGNRTKSSAVIANAWHHRSDALSSVPAFIAVFAASINPKWAFLDHIGALIISVFILKVSWDIMKPALAELTDHGASQKEYFEIQQIAQNVPGVQEAHKIRTRQFGSNIHVDLHILVNPELTVKAGHRISEEVKRTLISTGPDIIDVVVHLEPFEP